MAIHTELVSDLIFGPWGTCLNILFGPSCYVIAVVWPWCPVKFTLIWGKLQTELPHNWDPLDSLGWHPAHHMHGWPKIVFKRNISGDAVLASLLTTGLRFWKDYAPHKHLQSACWRIVQWDIFWHSLSWKHQEKNSETALRQWAY